MDLGPPLVSVCVIMSCLLGAARCSNGVKTNCPCPEIHQLPQTQPPPRDCFQINSTFRYKCIQGYVRKVGTSNLSKCKEIDGVGHWHMPSLKCIPDPKIIKTQPPTTTVTNHTAVFTTTVAAASTSLPQTQSISTAASVTAETESAEPTSLPTSRSLTYAVTETKTTEQTSTSTSTTTEPSNNGTVKPHVSDPQLGSATVAITCSSLVIVCALIGISSFLCYRRSQNNIPPHTADEQLPMNHPPAALAL